MSRPTFHPGPETKPATKCAKSLTFCVPEPETFCRLFKYKSAKTILSSTFLANYLFLGAHSFPRATLSEICSLLGTGNVRGQISEHIFVQNGGYCLFRVEW